MTRVSWQIQKGNRIINAPVTHKGTVLAWGPSVTILPDGDSKPIVLPAAALTVLAEKVEP